MSLRRDIVRHCLTLDLKDDASAIAEYERYHGGVWPEVLAHLSATGIIDMTIWRRGTRLMMLIETETDFDMTRLVTREDSHPRVREWERLMATFQEALPDSQGEGLWQVMSETFNLRKQASDA